MDKTLIPKYAQSQPEEIPEAIILIPVFDRNDQKIGACEVSMRQITASKFCVALAVGVPCEACQTVHTTFESILYDVSSTKDNQLCLIADSMKDAKHLPGFIE